GWVTQLGMGASPAFVANSIIRSGEAFGIVVDGMLRQFLNRDASGPERSSFVSILQGGATLEQVTNLFVSSAEYRLRFGSDGAFVQSLYLKLLNRTGSPAEVAAWVSMLPSMGRAGVAASVLASPEYRGVVVRRYYADLLHRGATDAEVSGWVSMPLDLLSIEVQFAAAGESPVNG